MIPGSQLSFVNNFKVNRNAVSDEQTIWKNLKCYRYPNTIYIRPVTHIENNYKNEYSYSVKPRNYKSFCTDCRKMGMFRRVVTIATSVTPKPELRECGKFNCETCEA